MQPKMWLKALQVIPRITREEWDRLDLISRWLIAARAAVLILTFISACIAGLAAARNGLFQWGYWLLLAVGLVAAHATNNLVNDWVDFHKGVDEGNYFRTQYGPQTLQAGLLTSRQLLAYAAVPASVAVACGLGLAAARGWPILALMAAGAFFVLFYTWPLKFFGLGEVAVILVWGPLMVGGGYLAVTGVWDWNAVWLGLPYALGATSVIFGKHIDKLDADKAKRIFTLPVLIGERAARGVLMTLTAGQYALVLVVAVAGGYSYWLLAALGGLFFLPRVWRMYVHPRPVEPPAEAKEFWPMWFVAAAFYQNRIFGMLYMAALILGAIFH